MGHGCGLSVGELDGVGTPPDPEADGLGDGADVPGEPDGVAEFVAGGIVTVEAAAPITLRALRGAAAPTAVALEVGDGVGVGQVCSEASVSAKSCGYGPPTGMQGSRFQAIPLITSLQLPGESSVAMATAAARVAPPPHTASSVPTSVSTTTTANGARSAVRLTPVDPILFPYRLRAPDLISVLYVVCGIEPFDMRITVLHQMARRPEPNVRQTRAS